MSAHTNNTSYIEYQFTVFPLEPGCEILIAELGYAGFESFVENETGVLAYIQKGDWHAQILEDIQILNSTEFKIEYQFIEIEQVNWNEAWEQNFNPISIENLCTIRAPFHPKTDSKFDIIIEPKMSFGTGHHETTQMMLQYILKNDFKNKSVLDMGCGTGVLAILAEKVGAQPIDAIDFDNWCFINSSENILRNQCKHITPLEGDAKVLKGKHYDIVLANINRNILLQDMATYAACLNANSLLFISGFYIDDVPILKATCKSFNLEFVEQLENNNWAALKFLKQP